MLYVNSVASSVLVLVIILECSVSIPTENMNFSKEDFKLRLEFEEVTGIYKDKAITELGETEERKESSLKALKELLKCKCQKFICMKSCEKSK